MSGNVQEWVYDWWAYKIAADVDPWGAQSGTSRLDRGGSWDWYPMSARSAYRGTTAPGDRAPYIGIRLVRSLP